ncbi:MAG: AAA family ATPase [Lautropia sp.]
MAPKDTTPNERIAERASLVDALARSLAGTPAAGDGPAILETHLSWVVLAGDDAWKVKKPVAFDFVDFSTLERRRLACEEELRLNRRYSPALYLAVVPIVGTVDAPRLGLPPPPAPGVAAGADPDASAVVASGPQAPIEYAVRMKRFSQRDIFGNMIADGRLDDDAIDALAAHVAALHAAALTAIEPQAGTPALVRRQTLQALDGVAAAHGDDGRLARIRANLGSVLDAAQVVLEARRAQGFVRECHADLHLANICRFEGSVAVFDCLEFDPLLRQIDVVADLAFTVADLLAWGRQDLAFRLLDRYLASSGDHAGLRVLRLYVAYRALVRARVALLSASAGRVPGARAARPTRPSVDDYLAVADTVLRPARPLLAILHGLSGSGKSRVAERLVARLPLIRLRSDVERKRLLGLPPLASTRSAPGEGAYGPAQSQATYAALAAKATQVIEAGFDVLVDATFQRRDDRRRFAALAASTGAGFAIVDVQADADVMRARIRQRLDAGADPSEADEQVLARQHATAEPLTDDERALGVRFDNSASRDAAALDAALLPVRERLASLRGGRDA